MDHKREIVVIEGVIEKESISSHPQTLDITTPDGNRFLLSTPEGNLLHPNPEKIVNRKVRVKGTKLLYTVFYEEIEII